MGLHAPTRYYYDYSRRPYISTSVGFRIISCPCWPVLRSLLNITLYSRRVNPPALLALRLAMRVDDGLEIARYPPVHRAGCPGEPTSVQLQFAPGCPPQRPMRASSTVLPQPWPEDSRLATNAVWPDVRLRGRRGGEDERSNATSVCFCLPPSCFGNLASALAARDLELKNMGND